MRLTWRTFPRFFWHQFLLGFCFHLLLPAVLILLIGLTTGWIGRAYGVFFLVWHEVPLKQGVVGFALVFLAWEVALVGYLLETSRTPYDQRYRLGFAGPAVCFLIGVVLSAASLVLLLLSLRFFAYLVGLDGGSTPSVLELRDIEWTPPAHGLPLLGGALLGLLLALFLTSLSTIAPWLQRPLQRLGGWIFHLFDRFPFLGVKRADEHDLFLHGVATLNTAIAVLFFSLVAFLPGAFSPVVGLGFLLHLLVGVYAFLAYFLPRFLPVVLFVWVLLGWLSGLSPYKERFPALAPYYAEPVALTTSSEPDPPLLKPNEIDFCGPARGIHAANTRRPLVVVCVSGGGLRSAAWTLAVLQKLEEEFRNKQIDLPAHIRIFTGASGGMVGASVYTASLPEPESEDAVVPPGELWENLTRDSLSPVIQQMAYGDLWSLFWAGPRRNDRGQALEKAWRNNVGCVLTTSFSRLREGERLGWRPSLIFSPMLVEDGRRLLVSNLDLSEITVNTAPLLDREPEFVLSIGALELFRLFPDKRTREAFAVGTAARMSASFPYISPAAVLPTSPRRRVVDAGYFDNYGVSLAAAWLTSPSTRAWMRDRVSGVLMIQIRDGQSEQERRLETVAPDRSRPLSRGLEWLTAPPQGLIHALESAAIFRNDEQMEGLKRLLTEEVQVAPLLARLSGAQIELLREAAKGQWPAAGVLELTDAWQQRFRTALLADPATKEQATALLEDVLDAYSHKGKPAFFATATFEFHGRVSLSWYLTPEEKKQLKRDLEVIETTEKIQRMIAWWKARPPNRPVAR